MKRIVLYALALLLSTPVQATVLDTSLGRVQLTGNGSTVVYVFAFPVNKPQFVSATVTAVTTGVLVPIAITVALNANQSATPGGTVTFASAPPNLSTITIQRTQPLTNELNLSTFQYTASSINNQFDVVIEQIQQVQRNLSDLTIPAAPSVPSFASLLSGNNTWTGNNSWTSGAGFNTLSVLGAGGGGDATILNVTNGSTGYLSVGGGIWPTDFVGGGIHTDQIADATGSWGLYLQDGGRTELFSDSLIVKDTSAFGIDFTLSGAARFNTQIVGNGGGAFFTGLSLTGTASKSSLSFTPQAQPTTHSDGSVYYGTDHLLHYWNGTAWTLIGGSLTTGATLTGAGTVASPLNVNQANSFSWTANNFWNKRQTFTGTFADADAVAAQFNGGRGGGGFAGGTGIVVNGGNETDSGGNLGVGIVVAGGHEQVLSGEGVSTVPGDAIVATGGAHTAVALRAFGGPGGASFQSGAGIVSTGGASNVGAGGAFEPGAGLVATGGDGTADSSGGGPGVLATGGPGGGVGVIGNGTGPNPGVIGNGAAAAGGQFTSNSADAITGTVSSGNGNGATLAGRGTGVGASVTGGVTNGNGINANAGGGNGNGVSAIGAGTGAGVTAFNGSSGPAILATTQGASSDVALKTNQQGTTHGGLLLNPLTAAPSAPANGELWVSGSTTAMNLSARLNGGTLKVCGSGTTTSASCQSKRGVTGCTTAASIGATCTTAITWTNAFADNLYFVTCIGVGMTGAPILQGTTARTTSSATIQTIALTAVAAQFTTIECFAFHD